MTIIPEQQTAPAAQHTIIEQKVFSAAKVPTLICVISFLALALLIIVPLVSSVFGNPVYSPASFSPYGTNNAIFYFYIPHLILFVICFMSGWVAYRIILASGVKSREVIPFQDYDLLAPLVTAGKSEGIDQYVRLSSLSGFTGTFTKLGLTGLPLATIGLTLIFAVLSLLKPDVFLDLTKLTLGAFLGSFVQRQVENRSSHRADEAKSQVK